MAVSMLCSVNIVFIRDCVNPKIWTGFVLHFPIKFQNRVWEAIQSLLSGKLHAFSPLLSSYKYVVNVKGIALPFAAYD